jgi:DnaJ like chaperone protein
MFQRIRPDNADHVAVPVEVHFTDGSTAKGKVLAPIGRSLADILNGAGGFVEFEPYGGEAAFIAKSRLVEVRPLGVPKGVNLRAKLAANEPLDPYAVLGIAPGSSHDQVRKAYFTLAKSYHPDRYASAELPPEVLEYLFTMARRVNAAYAALDGARRTQAAAASAPRQPAAAH